MIICIRLSTRLCHYDNIRSRRDFVSFCGFSPPCDLTNSAPYDTLAKLTRPEHIYEAKNAHKVLQRHSEDTPKQLHSNLAIKKQFYIYSYIKNLFFNIFCIRCYTFYIIPMSNYPCHNEGVSDHIGDKDNCSN